MNPDGMNLRPIATTTSADLAGAARAESASSLFTGADALTAPDLLSAECGVRSAERGQAVPAPDLTGDSVPNATDGNCGIRVGGIESQRENNTSLLSQERYANRPPSQ